MSYVGQYAKTLVAALTVVAEVLLQAQEIAGDAHELVIALVGLLLVYVVPNSPAPEKAGLHHRE